MLAGQILYGFSKISTSSDVVKFESIRKRVTSRRSVWKMQTAVMACLRQHELTVFGKPIKLNFWSCHLQLT